METKVRALRNARIHAYELGCALAAADTVKGREVVQRNLREHIERCTADPLIGDDALVRRHLSDAYARGQRLTIAGDDDLTSLLPELVIDTLPTLDEDFPTN